MEIHVRSVHQRHSSLTVTLAEDFLNGDVGHRAQRIMAKHMFGFREGRGNQAVFQMTPGYDLSSYTNRAGLQAIMDAWANVPISLTFARRPVVRAHHAQGAYEVHTIEDVRAAQANGSRIELAHWARLDNFPAIHRDTDRLKKVILGGVYSGINGETHVISMSGFLDIMRRSHENPWNIAAEWETAVREHVV